MQKRIDTSSNWDTAEVCQLLVHPTDNTDLDPSSKMTVETSGEFVSLVSDEVNDQNPSQAGT